MAEPEDVPLVLREFKAIIMAILEFQNVSFRYGNSLVVSGMNFPFEDGRFITMMGPSGCGKSTVLRLMAGLERPSAGDCLFEGNPLERPSPKLRFSFQDFDSFPWKTVRQNLLLGGATDGGDGAAFDADGLINKIGLTGHEHKYPAELSGGMRKRLALGRCLAGKPKVILLDEPFSSLDVDARQEMYDLLQSLWTEWRCLIVIVTHDIHEAIMLSERIVISDKLPFRIKHVVEVPFEFPRKASISDTMEYIELFRKIRKSL